MLSEPAVRLRFPAQPPPPSQIRQVEDLCGPAGALEALVNTGAPEAPLAGVFCHPYPPAGGSLHNKVVYHAMKTFASLGLPSLRFNFRGVGRSAGSFDEGQGEQDDVRAVVDWAQAHFQLPLILVGFSFGAYVGLRATREDERLVGRVGLGLPVRTGYRDYAYDFLPQCPGPMLFVSGDQDEFSPATELERVLSHVVVPHRTAILAGADHFFAGVKDSPASKLPEMQRALREWLLDQFAAEQPGTTTATVATPAGVPG